MEGKYVISGAGSHLKSIPSRASCACHAVRLRRMIFIYREGISTLEKQREIYAPFVLHKCRIYVNPPLLINWLILYQSPQIFELS
ncbi:hypothetical protein CDL12_05609 [Handroanthus impetiginosus]|uniref:Uncharacterized protein n=1 Tax=Handroanthus impetiginosus TaxID=429701 RepID=A0A2G9HW36_9LAMI|nr:hypothetical protein CDL12_05609 [Handroanthus impetiginosus]